MGCKCTGSGWDCPRAEAQSPKPVSPNSKPYLLGCRKIPTLALPSCSGTAGKELGQTLALQEPLQQNMRVLASCRLRPSHSKAVNSVSGSAILGEVYKRSSSFTLRVPVPSEH